MTERKFKVGDIIEDIDYHYEYHHPHPITIVRIDEGEEMYYARTLTDYGEIDDFKIPFCSEYSYEKFKNKDMKDEKVKTSLSIAYDNACNDYAKAFAEKHEMDYSDAFWVGEDVGTILCIGDYSFKFQEIKYDIDNNIDKDEIIKYYDYCIRAHILGFEKIMNYESWCKGCPRISEEAFAKVEKLKQELDRLIDEENNKRKNNITNETNRTQN